MRTGMGALVVILTAVAAAALADDYESGLDGRGIYPIKSKHIRMARERVEVYVDWEGGARSGHSAARVRSRFVLVNDSDEPQSILVSFPGGRHVKGETFTRCVDGESVDVKEYAARDGSIHAYTSRIEFRPWQVRTVSVAYLAEFDSEGTAIAAHWRYILTTGALWKGKIDRIVVVVHFPMDMPPEGVGPFDVKAVDLSPPGYKADGQKVTWVFKDIEPAKDIEIWLDVRQALMASDPLRLSSREEAPRHLYEKGTKLCWVSWSHPEEGIRTLEALRREFPRSWEARNAAFYLGMAYTLELPQGACVVPDAGVNGLRNPRNAVACLEEALETEVGREHATTCLLNLVTLLAQELNDAKRAEHCVGLLAQHLRKEERRQWRHTIEELMSLSARHGLMLIERLDQRPEGRADLARSVADSLAQQQGDERARELHELLRRRFPRAVAERAE